MLMSHFQLQLGRMSERWRGSYPQPLAELIWKEISNIPDASFTEIVNELMGTCRQAPLLPEFREQAAKQRERAWAKEKAQHERDAHNVMSGSVFTDEDQKWMFDTIRKRIRNNVSDAEWGDFMRVISETAKKSKQPKSIYDSHVVC